MTTLIPDGLAAQLMRTDTWHNWRDGHAEPVPVDGMTRAQLGVVIAYLRHHATALHKQQKQAYLDELRNGLYYAEVVEDLGEHARLTPRWWLEQTPLMRRLRELHDQQPAAPRTWWQRLLRRPA